MPAPRSRRSPAHAASLSAWERLGIVLILSLAVVGVVAFSVQRPPGQHIASPNVSPVSHATPNGNGTAVTPGSPVRVGSVPAARPQPKPPPASAPASPAESSGQGPAVSPPPPGSGQTGQNQIARTRSGSLFISVP
jgi:hypothetical protein